MGSKYKKRSKLQLLEVKKGDKDYAALAESLKGKVPHTRKIQSTVSGETKKKVVNVEIRTTPVVWGFPMDEVMFSKFFENIITSALIMPWDVIATARSTYLPQARNKIHAAFLEAKGINHLVMLDSDVIVVPWFLKQLLSHKKPLVGGWYKHKEPQMVFGNPVYQPVVYDYSTQDDGVDWFDRRQKEGKGLEKVDGIGAGALLMRRDVAEAIGEHPYDMNSGGEDLVMCKKVMDAGFDIYVDWDLACAHFGVSYV